MKAPKEDDYDKLARVVTESIPGEKPDIIPWAEANVEFPTSVLSKRFDPTLNPWIVEPIQRAVDLRTRIVTFMKPIQSGGSVAGEIVLLYWICFWRGFLQYNWKDNDRSLARWRSRIEGILRACPPVAALIQNAFRYMPCEVDFGNGVLLRVQGSFVSHNLDSDSVPMQLNEEIHSWEDGHLDKARGRCAAVWNYKQFNISNAGDKDDQLDKAYKRGTMQQWMVKCPGCSNYHSMRTRWEDRKPELGGLRYDAEAARLPGLMQYDYNIIRPTIRYQMPCGYTIHNEDLVKRRELSKSGHYSEPTNKGAELIYRSYTYESVIVDYMDWMDIIIQKHDALRARKCGDPEPFKIYKRERECIPYDPDDVPLVNVVTTNDMIVKSRVGLASPKFRFFSLDRQEGVRENNEFPHWWLLIRDFKIDENGMHSLLVYEGKVETDEQAIAIIDEHQCKRWMGVADSGDDTTHVYLFCLRYGIHAIKGGKEQFYSHSEGGARRVFSPERPLHKMIGRAPKYPYVTVNINGTATQMPDPREPMFWLYSRNGIRERLHWLRNNTDYQTPRDVSEDYRKHQDSEQREERISPTDGTISFVWNQLKKRNDQFVNEAYIAMQVDQAGIIMKVFPKLNEPPTKE